MVVVERSGNREIKRFEADTQAQAIADEKHWIAANEASVDSWVFAREGQFKENDVYVDALTIEAKTKGMKESIVFVQSFQPFYKGKFKLIGEPIVNIGTKDLGTTEAKLVNEQLLKGVQSHSKASPLWGGWTKP